MATPLLSISNLSVSFGGGAAPVRAVNGVSLSIAPGAAVAVVGESGSGKSTLARTILDLLPAAGRPQVEGRFAFDGQDCDAARRRSLRGREVAMVFQDPLSYLDPLMRVGRQIAEVLAVHEPAAAPDRVDELLAQVQLKPGIAAAFPHELSGGMRQRVMIAMALACGARLLIADEPTTALDVTTQAEILALISKLRAETGMALLLISHDLGVVSTMCDEVHVMYRGKVIEAGPVAQVFAHAEHDYTRSLIAAGSARNAPAGLAADPAEPPVLKLEGIRKSYGKGPHAVEVLRGSGIELRRGETLALVGESGSGKSTLAKVALSLVRPDAGRLELMGRDLLAMSPDALRRARTAMYPVFQDSSEAFNPRRPVLGILGQALAVAGVPQAEREARAIEVLEQVHLSPGAAFLHRYAHEMSGGQRQRLAIARALATGAEVLVADEPLSGADVSIRDRVVALLRELQAQRQLAILFITHDIWLARSFAHRVAVMYKGEIVEEGPAGEIIDAPRHPYTQRLVSAAPVVRETGPAVPA
ncbi:ABC transporter ATP-binding protein [Poseidonocella sp. HB161398]|uniref:dipeptide ABC transporter ATP-binding protein n=1 Tax=Poseidonocella sp. HB161398 TaxID=2320855 RepID=UPI001109AB8D|nr:ABC transporter ATP-binding protein [Poseidonocella sp. HB161398]